MINLRQRTCWSNLHAFHLDEPVKLVRTYACWGMDGRKAGALLDAVHNIEPPVLNVDLIPSVNEAFVVKRLLGGLLVSEVYIKAISDCLCGRKPV